MRWSRFTIDIVPMGAVRMTARGKWVSKPAMKYIAWKKEVSRQLEQQMLNQVVYDRAIRIEAIFYFVPSKSNKTAKIGVPVTKKPDFDNLVKGLCDAANKIVWTDDAIITSASIKKRYAEVPSIEMKVYYDIDEYEMMI